MTDPAVAPPTLFATDAPDDGAPTLVASQTTPTALWNDSADPAELVRAIHHGAVGATCNPVIALTTIRGNSDVWGPRLTHLAQENPHASENTIGWLAIEQMSVEAAQLLEPVFHAHNGRNGRLSVQTDPRLHRDVDALVAQAQHFNSLAPNIIVKIPATRAGIEAMRQATYLGISVNATVSFSVAQAVAVAEAVESSLLRREAEGLDTSTMGPVCTIMGGRLDDWVKESAVRERVLINPGYFEWAGVAALKKAYHLFRERGLRTRILSAAFRNYLQWSELLGGDLVVSPPFDWQMRINENHISPEPRIDIPVDPIILGTLYERCPEFRKAYDVDGMTVDEFEDFGATRRTLRQFLQASAELDALVRDLLVPEPGT